MRLRVKGEKGFQRRDEEKPRPPHSPPKHLTDDLPVRPEVPKERDQGDDPDPIERLGDILGDEAKLLRRKVEVADRDDKPRVERRSAPP